LRVSAALASLGERKKSPRIDFRRVGFVLLILSYRKHPAMVKARLISDP
jgi:hypothetical protein